MKYLLDRKLISAGRMSVFRILYSKYILSIKVRTVDVGG